MKIYWLLIILLFHSPAFAKSFELELPLDCTLGKDCVIQNYVDINPAEGKTAYQDYACGSLSYDSHTGTDFRALNESLLAKGINVLAAADGEVIAIRDSMPDMNLRDKGKESVAGRECGNGVVLKHKLGWETQYCHMKRDSITVKPEQKVKAGDVLGHMGMSGATEFPHLHMSLRKFGRVIDPFIGHVNPYDCTKAEERYSLWSATAQEQVKYIPSGILGGGFTTRPPKSHEIQAGEHRNTTLPGTDPVLVFWTELFGVRKNDVIKVTLQDHDGATVAEHSQTADRNMAVFMRYVGKRNLYGWPKGAYTGHVTVERPEGKTIHSQKWPLQIDGRPAKTPEE